MNALKAFTKPFEVPRKSVQIKISANFYFNTTLLKDTALWKG